MQALPPLTLLPALCRFGDFFIYFGQKFIPEVDATQRRENVSGVLKQEWNTHKRRNDDAKVTQVPAILFPSGESGL